MLDTILHQLGRKTTGLANGQPAIPESAVGWRTALAQLHALHEVEDDWDGQGAQAPEPANIEAALAWASTMNSRLTPPTRILPGVNGEVLLLWQAKDYYLEGEIQTPVKLEWMLAMPGQSIEHWETLLPSQAVPAT